MNDEKHNDTVPLTQTNPDTIADEISELVQDLVDTKVSEREEVVRNELKPASRWKSKTVCFITLITLVVSLYMNYTKGVTTNDVITESNNILNTVLSTNK